MWSTIDSTFSKEGKKYILHTIIVSFTQKANYTTENKTVSLHTLFERFLASIIYRSFVVCFTDLRLLRQWWWLSLESVIIIRWEGCYYIGRHNRMERETNPWRSPYSRRQDRRLAVYATCISVHTNTRLCISWFETIWWFHHKFQENKE